MRVDKTDRSKYNVGKNDNDKEKRTCEGILFDSQLEMKFYRDVILPQMRSGQIKECELQKKYVLQPKFNNGTKTILPIIYVADFYIEYTDERIEVIDTKGCPDSVAKIKRKMFWFQYPDIDYRWIGYVKKYGGWLDYDEIKRLRSIDKKKKTAEAIGVAEEIKGEGING